ncbi:hypothetical protein BH10PSE11_BH10PSE11_13790 [soil metagenome]
MKPLDLLEHFDKGAGAFGFIATYEFEPQFFERRMLAKRTFGNAERLVVFMDRGRYQELVNRGLQVSGFNRRYLVVPMDRAPAVFHPKLYLAVGEKRTDGMIGSNNCTNAGIAYNTELSSTFSLIADTKMQNDTESRSVLRQIYEAMKEFAAEAGKLKDIIEDQFFGPAEARFPWLHSKVVIPKGSIDLIHSHAKPLWGELIKRLEEQTVRKITVLSPFYDKELGFLTQLHKQWPSAVLTVIAQPEYATLAGKRLGKLFGNGKHRLFAANPKPGRRLHAKAFAFETNAGTFWLSGSPNATRAAFDGRNTEAAFWVQTRGRPDDLFKSSGLGLERISPADFKSGADQEPKNESKPKSELILGSAVLAESGMLLCEIEAPKSARDLALRIRNVNELLPVLSVPIRRSAESNFSVELDENQIAQIRSTAICEIKCIASSGSELVSNPVALVQLYQLLRERQAHHGGRDLRRTIEETGENLVSYVDSLSSVRDAVDFFSNCSIRFFDGESASRSVGFDIWKPRDPFKPDTPPNWLNLPKGGTPEELREAIREFVERHQTQKLYKHVRRGNLNGLPNFLDIFRTLNGLLLAYHARSMGGVGFVIPFGYVSKFFMHNLELLIGPFDHREDQYDGNGFISAIRANFRGDKAIVRDRLREERVPQMMLAAVEAMIDVRARALKKAGPDAWAANRIRWVSQWIEEQGLGQPTEADIHTARLEYTPEQQAA